MDRPATADHHAGSVEATASDLSAALHTVQFLRTKGLESLMKQFYISAKRHGKYPQLVGLHYDQIESPMNSPIVQECRALIVDESQNWKAINFPYTKFFNYGESKAQIDWATAKVYEKVDGSLCMLYNYKDEWFISSSSVPDGSGRIHGESGMTTLAELFWDAWKKSQYTIPTEKHYCFMFELLHPRLHRIVQVTGSQLYLHGARDMRTYAEVDVETVAKQFAFATPRRFHFESMDQRTYSDYPYLLSEYFVKVTARTVLVAAGKLDPIRQEGFVVCDGAWNRVKVKTPLYVTISLLSRRDKEGMNRRRMLEIVRANEGGEFLAYFPQWKTTYEEVKKAFDQYCTEIETTFAPLKEKPDNELGRALSAVPFSGVIWAMRRSGQTAKQVLKNQPVQKLIKDLAKYLPSTPALPETAADDDVDDNLDEEA